VEPEVAIKKPCQHGQGISNINVAYILRCFATAMGVYHDFQNTDFFGGKE
jgi:hypothetical protein